MDDTIWTVVTSTTTRFKRCWMLGIDVCSHPVQFLGQWWLLRSFLCHSIVCRVITPHISFSLSSIVEVIAKPVKSEYGCSGALQRRNPCVKPASGLTIYGNMCLPEQKQIVSGSLPRSFLVYSEDLSKIRFDNPIQGLRLWLAIEVRYHYDCYVSLLFEYNHRFATLIRTHWIHRLQRWWQNWTSLSLFCIVLLLQAMLLQWWLI